jgi:hypothetical protein
MPRPHRRPAGPLNPLLTWWAGSVCLRPLEKYVQGNLLHQERALV